MRLIDALIKRNGRINDEFYLDSLDSCINDAITLGLRCHLFKVDSFISWGTPNDLKTFEYWQPHLELDTRVDLSALRDLTALFIAKAPETSLSQPKYPNA